jgi:hypothetical protein
MTALLDLNLILLLLVHPLVILVLSVLNGRTNAGLWRWVTPVVLFPWFGAVVWFSGQPAVQDLASLPPPMTLVITIPLVIGLGLMFLPAWRRFLANLPQDWLIGLQVYRVLGYSFLVAWTLEIFPTELGLITGLMDILIGLSALWVVRLLGRPAGRRAALIWNVFGLLDFAWAVPLVLLAAPTSFQVLQLNPGVEAMGTQPFVLIAMWAVPFSILLHAASLLNLARTEQPTAALNSKPVASAAA